MLSDQPKRTRPNGISSRAVPVPGLCRVKQLNQAIVNAEHRQKL